MLNWIRRKLGVDELKRGLDDLEGRVDNLEGRMNTLEKEVERRIRHFGGYKHRTKKELTLMKKQVADLLETVETLINHQENKEGLDRAYAMRRRLRNHLTRINRNMNSQAS